MTDFPIQEIYLYLSIATTTKRKDDWKNKQKKPFVSRLKINGLNILHYRTYSEISLMSLFTSVHGKILIYNRSFLHKTTIVKS